MKERPLDNQQIMLKNDHQEQTFARPTNERMTTGQAATNDREDSRVPASEHLSVFR
jgi:hypothetical protein